MTDAAQARWTLREPDEKDLPALAALGRKTFADTFGALYAPKDLAAFQEQVWGKDGLWPEYRARDRIFRIAEADGVIIGFVKVGKPYLEAPDHEPGRSRTELCQLYVDAPWKGQGVAQALMQWALSEARAGGFDDIYLSVYVDNERAQRFYARYGFVEVGRHVFMVGEHEDDDRIWRLRLT